MFACDERIQFPGHMRIKLLRDTAHQRRALHFRPLIAIGCFRQLRTLNGKAQRPADIASERGFNQLAQLLEPPPDLIPHVSSADLAKIQERFEELVVEESRGMFKPDEMRVVDLTVLREVRKVFMPVAGMYGGFSARFEDDHLVVDSWYRIVDSRCRIVGG